MSWQQRLGGLSAAWLAFALTACGGTTSAKEGDSGNTNWLKACVTDAQCGDLACFCGSCRSACDAAVDCALPPAASCRGDAHGVESVSPEISLLREDPDTFAADLATLPDGSSLLVGGAGLYEFDLTNAYRDFWLARVDEAGEIAWEFRAPLADAASIGRSLAVTSTNEVITVSTIFDGNDTPAFSRFDQTGAKLSDWTGEPGITRLRAASDGELYGAGSQLLEWRDGRPFMAAWAGRLTPDGTIWQQAREGLAGSVSNVVSLDVDVAGNVLVSGSLGTAPDSNESVPWVGSLDATGEWLWEHTFEVATRSHCDADAAVFTSDGGTLVAGGCDGQWLRRLSASGSLVWERRFPWLVTALAALEDGYAVAMGTRGSGGIGDGDERYARLLRFDDQHRLRWRAELPSCLNFHRLVAAPDGLFALAECEQGSALARYVDR
jgi:hypothetical protein